jgi:hypothetical protein
MNALQIANLLFKLIQRGELLADATVFVTNDLSFENSPWIGPDRDTIIISNQPNQDALPQED